MKKVTSKITAPVLVLAAIAVTSIALAADGGVKTFESAFLKTLLEKFKTFYSKASQDRVYVQTDKAFYKPGETIWFTAYVRDAGSFKPSGNSDIVHVELITPKGTTEKHYKIVAKAGAAQGDFDLTGHPGGIYKIKAYTEWQKNDTGSYLFEKDIQVQEVVMPRLKMKLDFKKKAYGKGDEVIAKLELNTNANQPLANTKVDFEAQLGGSRLTKSAVTTDAQGKAELKFTLPENLSTNDGIVNAMIDFEGNTESVSRSIPIVLNKLSVDFYPEGGDMVNGVQQLVAFRALNEYGKPADVEGIVVDENGVFVANFRSYHYGIGAFEMTAQNGKTYKAHITKPEGIPDEFPLPEALTTGYTLHVNRGKNDLQLEVNSRDNEVLSVVAQIRGKVYYSGSFNALKGNNALTINTTDFPIGITQVTLFDAKGIARAERLVFVNKNKQLNISVNTDKQQYAPRSKVHMTVRVTDENGLPMPGNFSMAVVDDNELTFADDRQGNILAKMLLEPELKEKVDEPNFYFDPTKPKADEALDLLMMTSGWRRYTWRQINDADYPVITHRGEKAELSGTVYDGYTSKPIPNAQLNLMPNGRNIMADANGNFKIYQFDIASTNQLKISAPDYKPQVQTLYDYGSNNNVYLYNSKYDPRVYFIDAVPAQAGVAAPMGNMKLARAEDEIADMPLRKKALNEQKPEMANTKVEERKEEDLADLEDIDKNRNKDIVTATVADTTFIYGNTGDLRANGLMNFEKNLEGSAGNAVFYRAKEFAKKTYSPTDTSRSDFASTVYWNGNVVTDESGRAKIEFTTNDLIS
ncbi:MAG TPA: MG2 domain-containing protein, partial [Chitinophagales bacterium]|nr:MG2 domain-containing protein [Chitinophagales bacterium]